MLTTFPASTVCLSLRLQMRTFASRNPMRPRDDEGVDVDESTKDKTGARTETAQAGMQVLAQENPELGVQSTGMPTPVAMVAPPTMEPSVPLLPFVIPKIATNLHGAALRFQQVSLEAESLHYTRLLLAREHGLKRASYGMGAPVFKPLFLAVCHSIECYG